MPSSLDGDGLHQTVAHEVQWLCGVSIRLPLMSTSVEPGAEAISTAQHSTAQQRHYLILIP